MFFSGNMVTVFGWDEELDTPPPPLVTHDDGGSGDEGPHASGEGDAAAAAAPRSKPHDEINVDQYEQYKQNMTRWRRETFNALKEHDFFSLMRLSEASKRIMQELLAMLLRTLNAREVEEGNSNVAMLVTGKAETIHKRLQLDLADDQRWSAEADGLVTVCTDQYFASLVTLFIKAGAEYDVRVLQRFNRLPYLWYWLIVSPPCMYCFDRQRYASLIIGLELEHMDAGSAKLRFLWYLELVEAANTGFLARHVYFELVTWRKHTKGTIIHVEGANGIIVKITDLARRIEKPLLSARFTELKTLRDGGQDDEHVAEELFSVHNRCLQNFRGDEYQALQNYTGRWAHKSEPMAIDDRMFKPEPLRDAVHDPELDSNASGEEAPGAPDAAAPDAPEDPGVDLDKAWADSVREVRRRCGATIGKDMPTDLTATALRSSASSSVRFARASRIPLASSCWSAFPSFFKLSALRCFYACHGDSADELSWPADKDREIWLSATSLHNLCRLQRLELHLDDDGSTLVVKLAFAWAMLGIDGETDESSV